MAETYNPIVGLRGSDNMGGYKSRVAFIPANWVTAVPKLPDTISDDDDYVVAVGAFVFKESLTGAKPIGIECTDGTVKYSAPSQGELEGQSFAPAGEFYRAGAKKQYAAWSRKFNNTPGYLVLEDTDGNQLLVGQPGLLCNLKYEYDGGQKRADRRGIKATFSCDSKAPYVYLETKIDIDALCDFEATV